MHAYGCSLANDALRLQAAPATWTGLVNGRCAAQVAVTL